MIKIYDAIYIYLCILIDECRDHFVPITRLSIIRHLMTEKDFLKEEELKRFERFSKALDSAIINKYHGLLEDLKVGIINIVTGKMCAE